MQKDVSLLFAFVVIKLPFSNSTFFLVFFVIINEIKYPNMRKLVRKELFLKIRFFKMKITFDILKEIRQLRNIIFIAKIYGILSCESWSLDGESYVGHYNRF